MANLLSIEASPRKERSKSIAAAKAFLDVYTSSHPDDVVTTLDLWNMHLPEFDGDTINAKYKVMHGKDATDAEAAAWSKVVDFCQQFLAADKYLFSLPMWNFGIPYKLKHYFDIIAQPGQTFSFSPDTGYSGNVTGKPAVVIYARGGAYGSDNAMDLQKGYMDTLLSFMGFTDIHSVLVEPTAGAPEAVAEAEAKARELAETLARTV